jgi:hypothetical protein
VRAVFCKRVHVRNFRGKTQGLGSLRGIFREEEVRKVGGAGGASPWRSPPSTPDGAGPVS